MCVDVCTLWVEHRPRFGVVTDMSKHLVQWGKPSPVLVGKSQVASDELLYRSKCGRFVIRKRHYASIGSRSQTSFAYVLEKVDGTRVSVPLDTLNEAKECANWEIDPNWQP